MATDEEVRASWVAWAEEAYKNQRDDYERFESYYRGDHELEFATERWKDVFENLFENFSDNWCEVVVDSMAQRLHITGWTVEATDKEATKAAEDIWDENGLDVEEETFHIQTPVKGDAYAIVWPTPEESREVENQVDFVYHDALEVNVAYDPADRRKVIRASKRWQDEFGVWHLRIYTPTDIVGYRVEGNAKELWMSGMQAVPSILPSGWEIELETANQYGRVPVFHFKNKATGSTHGISEIKSVIPIQNAVNKVLMDMMLASEFGGFRQKWMSGGGHPPDGWKSGPSRIWASTDPNAKFGSFDESDLEQFTRVLETLVGHIAKITQTPMHYLRTSGDMPSGEALKTAESTLIHKCKSRQKQYGAAWSQAMAFAVELRLGRPPNSPLKPVWAKPETRHDLEQAQTAQLKSMLGIPLVQLWREHFNYTEEEIEKFVMANRAITATVLAQAIAQAGQLPPGMEGISNVDPKQIMQLLQNVSANGNGSGLDLAPMLQAMFPKSVSGQTASGEATIRPQANTRPPASPTRRSTGFKD